MGRVEININPQILRWAREEAGYDQVEVAEKISIDTERYKIWEQEGKKIPLGKLKDLANTYKRQLAVFLLPTTPEKISKPKDFRNLSPADSKFSKKVLDVMRDVNYFCQLAQELQGETYWAKRYEWIREAKEKINDNHTFHLQLREMLNIDIEDQLQFTSDYEAYRKWRLAVEDRLGILIFQFPMPIKEVEGFCFTEKLPYAIVVNSNYNYYHRIFTIFHELAHIIRNQSGICLFEKATVKQPEEFKCNEFAGNFLAPSDLIERTDNLKEIAAYASKLKISREVYLRRLKDENKISDLKFFHLLEQIKKSYKKTKKKDNKIIIKPEVKSRASRGETFYTMVLEAMNNNRISYTQASSALNLNVSRLLNEI